MRLVAHGDQQVERLVEESIERLSLLPGDVDAKLPHGGLRIASGPRALPHSKRSPPKASPFEGSGPIEHDYVGTGERYREVGPRTVPASLLSNPATETRATILQRTLEGLSRETRREIGERVQLRLGESHVESGVPARVRSLISSYESSACWQWLAELARSAVGRVPSPGWS